MIIELTLIILIFLSFLTGLLLWKTLAVPFRLFTVLIAITSVIEIIAFYVVQTGGTNHWIYNINLLPQLWLLSLCASALAKRFGTVILTGAALLSLVWFYMAFTRGLTVFFNKLFLVQEIFYVVVFVFILLKNSRNEQRFFKIPEVWLSLAVIIFYGGNIPIMGMLNYLNNNFLILSKNFYNLTQFLAFLHYVFVTTSFILMARQHRRSGLSIGNEARELQR